MTSQKQKTRTKPGRSGKGDFYHIGVRDKNQFETFRTHDVGKKGHIERVSGKRSSGSWATVKWLVSKSDATIKDSKLVGKSADAKDLLKKLGSTPTHVKGDYFEAKPKKNVPEKNKPTPAQTRARKQNIKKAQEARHS